MQDIYVKLKITTFFIGSILLKKGSLHSPPFSQATLVFGLEIKSGRWDKLGLFGLTLSIRWCPAVWQLTLIMRHVFVSESSVNLYWYLDRSLC